MKSFPIAGRALGPNEPVYVIAELSANHNQSLEAAIKLIEVAKESGADAVKIQTYTADTITMNCDNEYFRIQGTIWEGRTLYDLYQEAYTPWEWHPDLKLAADRIGIPIFSSPFDPTAVDLLESLKMPAYKVASFELVDFPLIRRIARTGMPIIMSTGMATLAEIEEAVAVVRQVNPRADLALLRCVSAYPACAEDMNLRNIPHLAETFGVLAGLSDHTLDHTAAVTSVALGGRIIEKHLTLSRADKGPDSEFSLEPHEFADMVTAARRAQAALGTVRYGPVEAEVRSRVFRRSLFAVETVQAGETLTPRNVRSIRPGHGMHTRHLEEVLGRSARVKIERGTPLDWSQIE